MIVFGILIGFVLFVAGLSLLTLSVSLIIDVIRDFKRRR